MATNTSTTSIFFASVPDYKDLCSVTLQVQDTFPSIRRDGNPSKYVGSQPQIVKCRELIFTEPGILASPSLQQEGHIYVVLQQSEWKSGRLQARCQKMGLQVNKPMRVISPVFQACLAYTIRARLAPLWNKAGNWYMQGRDFLIKSGKLATVDMELNVTEAEICLALRPMTAKLPKSSLDDFEVCRPVLEQFFLSKNNIISEYSIDSKWCYILPSLKKGKVVSISHEIPPTSPFKTYKDIRRYWKNAYGYRLPESSTGMLYYNVYFPAIGQTLFTYPECCIRKHEPILQVRVDPAPILNAFLTDLQYKIPTVCGAPFKITPKAQYTCPGLHPTGTEEGNLSQLTLSTTPPPTSVHRIPTRPLTLQGFPSTDGYTPTAPDTSQLAFIPTRSPAYPVSGMVNNVSAVSSTFSRTPLLGMNTVPQTESQVDGYIGTQAGYLQDRPIYRSEQEVVPSVNPFQSLPSVPQPAIVQNSCFRPVLPEQTNNSHAILNATYACTSNAYSPIVTPSYSTHTNIPAMNMMTINQLNIHTVAPDPPRIVPRFVPQRRRTSHHIATTSDPSQRLVPNFKPMKTAKLPPKSLPSISTFVSTKSTSAQHPLQSREDKRAHKEVPQVTIASGTEKQAVTKPAFAPSFSRKDSSRVAKSSSSTKKTQQTLDALFKKPSSSAQKPNSDCSKTMKRKSEDKDIDGPTASKKPRAKPKMQEGIDVQSLAINDQLSKVNTITLATWLKNKGIAVKAKDKKADLMLKVAKFIHANSTED